VVVTEEKEVTEKVEDEMVVVKRQPKKKLPKISLAEELKKYPPLKNGRSSNRPH